MRGRGIVFPLYIESGGRAVRREDIVKVLHIGSQVLGIVVGDGEIGAIDSPVD